MKVYAVRVDSVCNDLRRLGYGCANRSMFAKLTVPCVTDKWTSNWEIDGWFSLNTAKDDDATADAHSTRIRHQADDGTPEKVTHSDKDKLRKKRRIRPNVTTSLAQLNAPLKLMSMPDDLMAKLNSINDDTAASNRLFVTVLPTKDYSLQLNSGERFIEQSTEHEAVQVRSKDTFILDWIWSEDPFSI